MSAARDVWRRLSRRGKVWTVVGAVALTGGVGNALEGPAEPGDQVAFVDAPTNAPGSTSTTTTTAPPATTTQPPASTTTAAPIAATTTVATSTTSATTTTSTTTSSTATTATTTTLRPLVTASAAGCHPSYEPCVPIASDVDCIGGSGNGPEYVGRVRVIGPDEYRLDADDDGFGCDNDPPWNP